MAKLWTSDLMMVFASAFDADGLAAIDPSLGGYRGWAGATKEEALEKYFTVATKFYFPAVVFDDPTYDTFTDFATPSNDWVTSLAAPAITDCSYARYIYQPATVTPNPHSGGTIDTFFGVITVYAIDSDYVVQYDGMDQPMAPSVSAGFNTLIDDNTFPSFPLWDYPILLSNMTGPTYYQDPAVTDVAPVPYEITEVTLQMAFNHVTTFYPATAQVGVLNKYRNGTPLIRGTFAEGTRTAVVRPSLLGGFMIYEEVADVPTGILLVYNQNRRLQVVTSVENLSQYIPI